ncbi:serpin B5-like [Aphidius gifuensis]|uniref:serpin B5-like n=1 Tax=Aphidius gifuensis TaxID=684658 RepID=UPI001CDCECDB|nr:serpin B5-like [Aphidius gifuensis]
MSLDFLKILLETQTGNFISSPFSVSQLLMILSTGSRGGTKHQFEKVLHIKPADTFEHGSLDFTSKWDKNILSMANKIYINDRYTIRKQFIDNTLFSKKGESMG